MAFVELEALRQLLSMSTLLDIRMVLAKKRPAARISCMRRDLSNLASALSSTGLEVLTGFKSVSKANSDSGEEWTSFRNHDPLFESRSFVYVGFDIRHLERLRRADERVDDEETGKLLGYPGCCVSTFSGHRQGLDEYKPLWYWAKHNVQAPWLVNVAAFSSDLSLLSHVPCSTDCFASLDMAAMSYGMLWDTDLNLALRLPLVLSGLYLIGPDNSYLQLLTRQNEGREVVLSVGERRGLTILADDMLCLKEIEILHSHTLVGEICLAADQVRCLRFN